MKARDGDSQVKKSAEHGARKTGGDSPSGRCPSCGTEVPSKPGFRTSALKCPKCGTQVGRR